MPNHIFFIIFCRSKLFFLNSKLERNLSFQDEEERPNFSKHLKAFLCCRMRGGLLQPVARCLEQVQQQDDQHRHPK